jgi:uncharacterized protein (DUF305 family)
VNSVRTVAALGSAGEFPIEQWQTPPVELRDPSAAHADAGLTDAGTIDAGTIDDGIDDGTIVLPWWQHPLNIVTSLVAVALMAGMIGWLVADSNSGPDYGEIDVGFLQDMREHHEQAVAMSFLFLALDDTAPGLRTVARSIAFGQGIEIGRMIQLLRDFGEDEANVGETSMNWMGMSAEVGSMPGMASSEQLDQLANSSGGDADRLFVELMVAHHLGGVEMAAFAAERAENPEVRAMAASIVDSQQGEVNELERLVD